MINGPDSEWHLRPPENEKLQEFLAFAVELALELGDNTVNRRANAKVVSRDLETGLVTDAEVANTDLITHRIKERFPSHGILTEELSKTATPIDVLPPQYEWVIDEVDGTKNFSSGLDKPIVDSPDWSISVGLRGREGEGLVGVVYVPDHGALYTSAKGSGAFLEKNGLRAPLHVSGPESTNRFVMSFNVNIDPNQLSAIMIGIGNFEEVGKLKPRIRESSALELCYVASGTDDAFLHTKTQPHDVVAGLVIAKEAGAQLSWVSPKALLVSNGQIHNGLENLTRNVLVRIG